MCRGICRSQWRSIGRRRVTCLNSPQATTWLVHSLAIECYMYTNLKPRTLFRPYRYLCILVLVSCDREAAQVEAVVASTAFVAKALPVWKLN